MMYLYLVINDHGGKPLTVPSVDAVKNSAPLFELIQMALYTGSE